MKVFIKNKIMSWGNGSSVTDETGKTVFEVKGKVFSITRKKISVRCGGKQAVYRPQQMAQPVYPQGVYLR